MDSAKDPDEITYVSFFKGFNSSAEMNGVPEPVLPKQLGYSPVREHV